MPFIEPPDMMTGAPLPDWKGLFFHSENKTLNGRSPLMQLHFMNITTNKKRCGAWLKAKS
jgi:hypothetical protein